MCYCNDLWICEAHPNTGWPHDECIGPGMPCYHCYPRELEEKLMEAYNDIIDAYKLFLASSTSSGYHANLRKWRTKVRDIVKNDWLG
jgi:hypothetical protein